mmetsp:Transcript_23765/g.51394  ORF Transcript_23765/g.51394 Transcript_23765/m.51394 type:complete len:592 (+) Transcript_23765:308-2083(+)|eukprot:CAMPEP_0172306648 /NCGR_PEP_ID=MMETSP1058-20130122/7677_1 /TAXON_ID=83371 /ORGANISM="Detonula confervacea, Strain CCMP 353" /LENGTH=591 /DNA_ID=CAMNT_0013018605 /DNA_START=252 /DNA_END=2027 /DNA_ORIENTATION=-
MGSSSKKTKGVGSPSALTFKAGGKKGIRHDHDQPNKESKAPSMIRRSPSPPSSSINNNAHAHITTPSLPSIIQTGLAQKRSPLQIKSWIACVLTLDGRDKFTKLLQYTSRLLCWYFAVLSKRKTTATAIGGIVGAAAGTVGAVGMQQQYFMALSKRFESLYKSLVTSRKAFRLGRSVIELDKLSSMGWGDYLGYMLLHPLAEGVANNGDVSEEKGGQQSGEGMMDVPPGSTGTLARYDTHPILEEEEEEEESTSHDDELDGDESSWNEDDEKSVNTDDDGETTEEKKLDNNYPLVPSSTKVKVVSRPGRPKLPSRISSNVGWGPSNTTSATTTNATSSGTKGTKEQSSSGKPPPNPPTRTVSEMGRQMYQPFPSRSSSMGSYKQVKDTNTASIPSSIVSTTTTATPSYKLIGGTIKLLGLMGFWAFDNLSFLTSSGFLDPIRSSVSGNGGADGIEVDASSNTRMQRKKRASEYAVRCYYFGVVAGLYVNARALWDHRKGVLKEAYKRLDEEHDGKEAEIAAQAHLQQTKQKHFELMLALLKSSCDFMVFSNNPGVDLYLKFWGKKNHEGLHCLGGLISASTVLYNNFPNAK